MTIKKIFDVYQFEYFEKEGVYIRNVYNSSFKNIQGHPCTSHAIGIYCHEPKSFSRFHMLEHDELWHFYGGDPFVLYLLFPDGSFQTVCMGKNSEKGERLFFLVPAGTWQAGELIDGEYALFACTMSPAFDPGIFHFRNPELLKRQFPEAAQLIDRL